MEQYIGKSCPFCKTEITEADQVKICPSCGAVHHLNCWNENKGCTTFGCSEQHYEEQHTNPTDVCAKCGSTLGDGQMFCPKCGAPKGAPAVKRCPKCGIEIAGDQIFCPKCGHRVAGENTSFSYQNNNFDKIGSKVTEITNSKPAAKVKGFFKKNRFLKIVDICGMISGIISIINSFAINDRYTGAHESPISYGGDAYTGIQNAAAQTADNIVYLANIVQSGFSYLLFVLGVFIICYFLIRLKKDMEK